jgi:GTP pyrophosphokinase
MNDRVHIPWLRQLHEQLPRGAEQSLEHAYIFVENLAHEHELSVEPLLLHAQGIVEILLPLHIDSPPLVAAFFCNIPPAILSFEALDSVLGSEVAHLVEGVHKLRIVDDYKSHSHTWQNESEHLEGLRKLLLGMVDDVRVVLIKLAERVQIMRELKNMPDEAQRHVARETMDIFAPLANRMGVWPLKWELEDLSFRFLEPENYKHIAMLLAERRADREHYITDVVGVLQYELAAVDITASIKGRPKHIYSIWRKMKGKSVDFQDLFDVRAVRVLVDNVADCYAVLGLVHSIWHPIRSEFDDYIASPKGNMYQSLHTAVLGPAGKTLEIQIRTFDMHQHSEHGVAAHWGYKEGGKHKDAYREKIAWLRQVLEGTEDDTLGDNLADRFKSEAFQDRVYVLSPHGKVVDMAKGSTPLDFAYHIHTDIGHGYRGAKVNGKIVSISHVLNSGEQVEILTSKKSTPSRDWLNPHLHYFHNASTRTKVRSWFRQQNYDDNVLLGRSLIEKEFHRLAVTDMNVDRLAERFKYSGTGKFLAAVGCGDISTAQINSRLAEHILPSKSAVKLAAVAQRVSRSAGKSGSARAGSPAEANVHILGVGDLLTHLARCCKPLPYDAIVGYITRARGVTVHCNDCANLLRLKRQEPERLIEIVWSSEHHQTYVIDIHVKAFDRQGLLRDITDVLTQTQLNVTAVNTLTDPKTHIAQMTLRMDVKDVEQLSQALTRLEQLPNVMAATRHDV